MDAHDSSPICPSSLGLISAKMPTSSHPGRAKEPLCTLCSTMFSQEGLRDLRGKGYMHNDAITCAQSAAKGCRLCRFILDASRPNWRNAKNVPFMFTARCHNAAPLHKNSMDTLHAEGVYPKDDPRGGNLMISDLTMITSEGKWQRGAQRSLCNSTRPVCFSAAAEPLTGASGKMTP